MTRFIYKSVPVFALIVALASCKKDTTTTTPTTPTTPTNTQGPQPVTPMPTGNNLSGALISIKMKYTTQPTGSPIPIDVTSEMGVGAFYASPGSSTLSDAGTVSVNSNNLEKQTNNSYLKWAYIGGTPADLGFDGSSNWNVGGSGSVTAFSFDDNAAFPEYTGTMPASVTKANGVTLTLNSSTISGADSVYVLISAGNQSVLKRYGTSAGSITITTSDLQALPVTTDNTAVFEVCPFRYKEVVKNGKNYFSIKELAMVRNININ
jgi:hypothetical protein